VGFCAKLGDFGQDRENPQNSGGRVEVMILPFFYTDTLILKYQIAAAVDNNSSNLSNLSFNLRQTYQFIIKILKFSTTKTFLTQLHNHF